MGKRSPTCAPMHLGLLYSHEKNYEKLLEKFNRKYIRIDNANIHLNAKFVNEQKSQQGETKEENKDIIG
jgi:hypothetical protein